jgi:hypothetical protein
MGRSFIRAELLYCKLISCTFLSKPAVHLARVFQNIRGHTRGCIFLIKNSYMQLNNDRVASSFGNCSRRITLRYRSQVSHTILKFPRLIHCTFNIRYCIGSESILTRILNQTSVANMDKSMAILYNARRPAEVDRLRLMPLVMAIMHAVYRTDGTAVLRHPSIRPN